jgi:hypothetical protein
MEMASIINALEKIEEPLKPKLTIGGAALV